MVDTWCHLPQEGSAVELLNSTQTGSVGVRDLVFIDTKVKVILYRIFLAHQNNIITNYALWSARVFPKRYTLPEKFYSHEFILLFIFISSYSSRFSITLIFKVTGGYTSLLEKYPTFFLRKPGGFH